MKTFQNLSTVLAIVLMTFSLGSTATGELVRLKMMGAVTVNDPTFVLPAGVVTGAAFAAYLTYDTSVPDSLPEDPGRGRYDFYRSDSQFNLSISIGEIVLRNDPGDDLVRIEVLDNAPVLPGFSPPSDSFQMMGIGLVGGPELPDPYSLERLQMEWHNLSQDSWSTDELPTFLDPGAFARAEIIASRPDELPPHGRPYDITASVMRVILIPEPCAMLFIPVAAGSCLVIYRSNRMPRIESRSNSFWGKGDQLVQRSPYCTGKSHEAHEQEQGARTSQRNEIGLRGLGAPNAAIGDARRN